MILDENEPRPAVGANLKALIREDLDPYSVDDLNERIELLKAEIERCGRAISGKQDKKSAAEALFNFR
jgi:uncharacterized small protein (DUF1192 family)